MSEKLVITLFTIVFGTIILLVILMLVFSHITAKKTKKPKRKVIKCESCGATNEVTVGEISTCAFCGSKTQEEEVSLDNDISKIVNNMQKTITNMFNEIDKH